MNNLIVHKSRLVDQVELNGAKNSALRLLAASILTEEPIEFYRSPNGLLDMQLHISMLKKFGKTCIENENYLRIEENNLINNELLWDERSIRNSLLILGSFTTRFGEGRVPLPGGCKLCDRKYDLHVIILEEMGARVWEDEGYLCAKSSGKLIGCEIHLPIRSTDATENAILCGTLAVGRTIIWNPHIRLEILDLINMLRKKKGCKY